MEVVLATLFALIAGLGTSFSPCVLPVLPIVLSGSATGGRRRPAGIALGLACTFTFTTLALAYVISLLGLPDTLLRTVAIVVLIGFGVVLLVPWLAARVEGWLSRWTPQRRVDGFGSGFLLGGALGFVYAPCAGPILAAVLTVQASQELTAQRLTVGIAYGLGTAAGVLAIGLLGRRLVPQAGRFQMAMGAVMVLTAALMLGGFDTRFRTEIADRLPSFLVNPTGALEDVAAASDLPEYGPAPDFTGTQRWFNSAPLSISGLRGKVVLVDFWTYTCINCLRTLPKLREWDARYRAAGLQIVGVHTPEFAFEKDAGNVERAIRVNQLRYPVVQDNDFAVWNAYSNQYWPAKYLVDAEGNVRYAHFGEGGYEETEHVIEELLAEAGGGKPAAVSTVEPETADPSVSTPETYLGSARAKGFRELSPGSRDYGPLPADLGQDEFALGGRWDVGRESATAGAGASLRVRFGARKVFLVLGPPARRGRVRASVDGGPARMVRVGAQDLYTLADLPEAGSHVLTLRFDAGVSGFAFTFG